MFELEYLYEQLKVKTVEAQYINVLDSISEACYDTVEANRSVLEVVSAIEEASNKNKFTFIDKMKAQFTKVETVLKKYKDPALKCKPIGLEYKDYKTFISDSELKRLHTQAINELNKFNPDKASAEEARNYIKDSQNNVQYNKIVATFGMKVKDTVITNKKDKEITKNDIAAAVKFIESYNKNISYLQSEMRRKSDEFVSYVRSKDANTLDMNTTKTDDIERLRRNARNHKISLVSIADDFYYQSLYTRYSYELEQAKRIVVKAANYNPRNLKESAIIQNYIDAMYECEEM